mgnify:CR=1 FL=1
MSAYEKPMIHVVPEQAEGIFMASGDKTAVSYTHLTLPTTERV